MAVWRCLTSPTPKRSPAMTEVQGKPSIVAARALLKGDPEGLRELVRAVLQEALEAEMSDALGAAKSERTTGRLGYRSGYYVARSSRVSASWSCECRRIGRGGSPPSCSS